MSRISSFVICFPMGALRFRLSLRLEVAGLRHQLSRVPGAQRRPPISSSDRLLWSIIARVWSGWRKAWFFVQPRPVLVWRHDRFRDHRRGPSGGVAVGARAEVPAARSRGCLWKPISQTRARSGDECTGDECTGDEGTPDRTAEPVAESLCRARHRQHSQDVFGSRRRPRRTPSQTASP